MALDANASWISSQVCHGTLMLRTGVSQILSHQFSASCVDNWACFRSWHAARFSPMQLQVCNHTSLSLGVRGPSTTHRMGGRR
ncbi:hypothetical protein BRADI_4g34255v3 [Brachypodium distachyon]|uniref:Uncharacterized protein n=1 Tax=Brachypodium distachyon TaxID=15368 RepID=A0A2K2CS65_BRADI|nr:hypothetical protein BRADI_4g34255v3 [Brachypodium distachyon]PNT64878.1 hypothetical protein BRADI_4g34255v3 [Brachypodium distachyon]